MYMQLHVFIDLHVATAAVYGVGLLDLDLVQAGVLPVVPAGTSRATGTRSGHLVPGTTAV